jgi:Ribbon-helix-helix domain
MAGLLALSLSDASLQEEAYQREAIFSRQALCRFQRPQDEREPRRQFWNALKEIAGKRAIHLSDLVAEVDEQCGHGNLSSALRVFVLDYYKGREGAGGLRSDEPQHN